MELYELLNEALNDLEPMPDQVADAQRIGRRRQRATLSAVFATGAAFAIGAGTLIVSAPWAGHSGLAPNAAADMTLASYSQLVDATMSRLWPLQGRQVGHVNVEISDVFPIKEVPIEFAPNGEFISPLLDLGITRQTTAAAQHAQICPTPEPGTFCTTSTLADGTVVQVSNLDRPLPQITDFSTGSPVPPLTYATWSGLVATGAPTSSSFAQLVPVGGSAESDMSVVVLFDEVSVWEGNNVETLFVPSSPTNAPTQAQLLALGSSSDFQQLLAIAAESNLIPVGAIADSSSSPGSSDPSMFPTTTPSAILIIPTDSAPPPPPLPATSEPGTATPALPTLTDIPTTPPTIAPN